MEECSGSTWPRSQRVKCSNPRWNKLLCNFPNKKKNKDSKNCKKLKEKSLYVLKVIHCRLDSWLHFKDTTSLASFSSSNTKENILMWCIRYLHKMELKILKWLCYHFNMATYNSHFHLSLLICVLLVFRSKNV